MEDVQSHIKSFYDEWQLAVIKADPRQRTRVIAGPGTGKTTTLAAKVAWMVRVQGMNPDGLLVLSFTRKAVAGIRNKTTDLLDEEAKAVNENVRTFDSYCTMLLEGPMKDQADRLKATRYASRIESVTQRLIDDPSPVARLRHVIVDEYQDLVGVRADFVLQLIDSLPEECGVTLLGDPCQAIYDYQVRNTGERDYEGFRRVNDGQPGFVDLELVREYRSSGSSRPGWLSEDLRALRGAILSGSVPAAGAAASVAAEDVALKAEKVTLMGEVRRRARAEFAGREGQPGRKLGVIARTNRGAISAYHELLKAIRSDAVKAVRPDAVKVELVKDERYSRNTNNAKDDEEPGIYIYTVHTSKGREFDEIWLCQDTVNDLMRCCGMPRFEQAEEARVAYVALTRSKGSILVLQRLRAQ